DPRGEPHSWDAGDRPSDRRPHRARRADGRRHPLRGHGGMPSSHGAAATRSEPPSDARPPGPARCSKPLVAGASHAGIPRIGRRPPGTRFHPSHRRRRMSFALRPTAPGATTDLEEAPILTYHSLDDSGSRVSTSPAQFRRQVELLRTGGFEAITPAELLAVWDGTA